MQAHPPASAVPSPTRPGGYPRLHILFLAYTGLRFGELAALRVERLDPSGAAH